jgi:hypothetical protein
VNSSVELEHCYNELGIPSCYTNCGDAKGPLQHHTGLILVCIVVKNGTLGNKFLSPCLISGQGVAFLGYATHAGHGLLNSEIPALGKRVCRIANRASINSKRVERKGVQGCCGSCVETEQGGAVIRRTMGLKREKGCQYI